MYFYLLASAMMLAILINYQDGRSKMLALLFTYIAVAYQLLMPSGRDLGVWWYWMLCTGEVSVILVAMLLRAPASRIIMACSFGLYILDILTATEYNTDAHFFYDLFVPAKRTLEITQVCALFLWSPPVLRALARIQSHLEERKDTWMRRLSKIRFG